MSNGRRDLRRNIIGTAELVDANENVLLNASIFNLSDSGMMIGTPLSYQFPETFSVRQCGSGVRQPASVAWQKPGLAGIRFLSG
jgi:hypothetical protein